MKYTSRLIDAGNRSLAQRAYSANRKSPSADFKEEMSTYVARLKDLGLKNVKIDAANRRILTKSEFGTMDESELKAALPSYMKIREVLGNYAFTTK